MDRVLYLANNGTARFGLFSDNSNQSIGGANAYNDGRLASGQRDRRPGRRGAVRRRRAGRRQRGVPGRLGVRRSLAARRGQLLRLDQPADQRIPGRIDRERCRVSDGAVRGQDAGAFRGRGGTPRRRMSRRSPRSRRAAMPWSARSTRWHVELTGPSPGTPGISVTARGTGATPSHLYATAGISSVMPPAAYGTISVTGRSGQLAFAPVLHSR